MIEKIKRRLIGKPELTLPPHSLFCECSDCTITPRTYRRALKELEKE